jgi:predicted TPR repeat methyltransferase
MSDWRALGNAHYDAQRWGEAALAFEKTLELEPDSVETWFRLGNAYQEQGRDLRAIECFQEALARDPSHARSWNNIGTSRLKLGQEALAAEAFRQALASDPTLAQAVSNLAHSDQRESHRSAMELLARRVQPHIKEAELAIARGDYAAAEAPLQAALQSVPDNPTLLHMIAAVRGQTTDRAPGSYVRSTFDDFAQNFDRVLRDDLAYSVPEQLAELVMPLLRRANPAQVIDLGCGTGLLGAALAPLRASIVGIDLSSKMLELAVRRGAYARVVQGDLVEELERVPSATVDAVLATDVFVYIGDLRAVFAAASRVLVPGGLFAFSVEALDEGDFKLRPSGRYAHSSGYLRQLAAQAGLTELWMRRIRMRLEREVFLEGWLACFAAPDPRR